MKITDLIRFVLVCIGILIFINTMIVFADMTAINSKMPKDNPTYKGIHFFAVFLESVWDVIKLMIIYLFVAFLEFGIIFFKKRSGIVDKVDD